MSSTPSSFALGIDIGGTKIYTVVVDEDYNILGRGKKKTGDGSPGQLMQRLYVSIDEAIQNAGVTFDQIHTAGVGFPGPLDPDKGIILQATNLPAWSHFPLADEISTHINAPVFIDNDVNLGTYGEAMLGAGAGAKNVIGIFLGTGVGGGIIIDGKIYHGTAGTAGEVGHVIIQHGGIPGPFGLKGSVEGLTSRNAIIRSIRNDIKKGKKSSLEVLFKSGKKIGSSQLAAAYRDGDSVVIKAFHHAAELVGVTMGSLINLLAPDVVILGGGVISAVPEAVVPIAKKVAMRIMLESNRKTSRIEIAALGDDAGALGAAFYARHRLKGE
ncbi:MAG: ROK family protein [Candidatus Omnitrophica bacterium]|nr:ROK family protein [Candidatus Omnitrophota bacterium]